MTDISLVEAAMMLGFRYHRALNAVLVGDITGRRDSDGRWRVDKASVEGFAAARVASERAMEKARKRT